jgi:CRISPR/Cas system-associated exonuclease Cas4 (RecB family)
MLFNRVEAAEQPFAVEIDDVIVAGKIDLIRDMDGRMKEIVDFKTSGSEAVSREQAMLQMDIYAVGLEKTAGVRVGLQTLHFLEDGITRSEEWSVRKKAEVENMIARIVASIKKAEFRPRVEYCPYCAEFKTICPYFVGARERGRTDTGGAALEKKAFRQIKGVRSRRKGQKKD